jgi:hypothetical protein
MFFTEKMNTMYFEVQKMVYRNINLKMMRIGSDIVVMRIRERYYSEQDSIESDFEEILNKELETKTQYVNGNTTTGPDNDASPIS